MAEHLGLYPVGRVGKACAPVVRLYGQPRAREMLEAYARSAPHMRPGGAVDPDYHAPQFCSPEKFAQTAAFWHDYTEPLIIAGSIAPNGRS